MQKKLLTLVTKIRFPYNKKKLTIILQKISAPESDKDIPVFKGGTYYDVPIYDTK